MAKDTIKLAGPDANNNYRVLATKGTLKVRPGELYSERYVKDYLLALSQKNRFDVTIIMPRFSEGEAASGILGVFKGQPAA